MAGARRLLFSAAGALGPGDVEHTSLRIPYDIARAGQSQACLMCGPGIQGGGIHERSATPRPRVRGWRSRASKINLRWAMDVTHVDCGRDGWAHLAAVIDCCDREVIGYELSLRARARESEHALEEACIRRFGTLRPDCSSLILRSDKGLIFTSKRFRAAYRHYRVQQEFITPYTPEQNGIVERFFRSLKEECVWQRNFSSFEECRREIRRWIDWYNSTRPHQALGYLSPKEYQQKQAALVA